MKRVTQYDIARELGISHATVALVVGRTDSPLRKRLSPATVKRVQEKAKEMGYELHREAQMLRTGKSNLIVVLNFGGYSTLTAERIHHLSDLVQRQGYDFLAIDAFWGGHDDPEKALGQVTGLRPEGLIVIESPRPPFSREHVKNLMERGIPVVTLATEIDGIPGVLHDVGRATLELTRHALAQGRKRLLLLTSGAHTVHTSWQLRERTNGFRQAFAEAGLPAPDEAFGFTQQYRPGGSRTAQGLMVRYTECEAFQAVATSGLRTRYAALELMAQPLRPDAVICGNDEYALSLLTQCYRQGVEVPRELWVSGFDNLRYGLEGPVYLTTVAHNIEALCLETIDILTRCMAAKAKGKAGKTVPAQRIVPCEIIWRESTGDA